jgi:hypothetical protein
VNFSLTCTLSVEDIYGEDHPVTLKETIKEILTKGLKEINAEELIKVESLEITED